jgi:hypothetical protein
MALQAATFQAQGQGPESELDSVAKSLLENTNPEPEGQPDPEDSPIDDAAQGTDDLDADEAEDQSLENTVDEDEDDPQESGEDEEELEYAASDEDDDEEVEDEGEELSADALIDVKVDGEVKQVTLDELTRDYSGRQAIDARLQQASEARNAAIAEANQLQIERENATKALKFAQGILAQQADPKIDWEELHELDPAEWAYQRQKAADKQAQFNSIAQALQDQEQQAIAQANAERDQIVNEQRAVLREAYPVFNDQVKGEERRLKLEDFAIERYGKYGLTKDQIAGVQMAVPMIMLGEIYDMVNGEGQPKPKKKAKRRVKRTVRPGTGTRITPATQSKKAMERLQKRAMETGHPDDVAKLLLNP